MTQAEICTPTWLNARGNSMHNNFVDSAIAPPLRLKWKRPVPDCGHLLFNGEVLIVPRKAMISGVNPETGATLWEFPAQTKREFEFSRLAGDENGIYVDYLHIMNTRNKLRALDWRTGKLRWEHKDLQEPCHWNYEVVASGGRVAYGDYEIDTATGKAELIGEQFRGNKYYGKSEYLIESFGNKFAVFDRLARKLLWKCKDSGSEICINSRHAIFTTAINDVDGVSIHDLRTGQAISYLEKSVCRLACSDQLLFGTDEKSCFRIDPQSGKILWTKAYNGSDIQGQSLVLTSNYLWHNATIDSQDPSAAHYVLRAYDALSGRIAWQYNAKGYAWNPIVAGNYLLLHTSNALLCFEPDTGKEAAGKPAALVPQAPVNAKDLLKSARKPEEIHAKDARKAAGAAVDLGKGVILKVAPIDRKKLGASLIVDGKTELLKCRGGIISASDVLSRAGVAAIAFSSTLFIVRNGKARSIKLNDPAHGLVISRDGKFVACGTAAIEDEIYDAAITIFDTETGAVARDCPLDPDKLVPTELKWVSDGRIVYTAVGDYDEPKLVLNPADGTVEELKKGR